MSSEVRHLVDSGRPFPLVRLTGVLDVANAPAIRSVLLDVLAGQPEALVVDVTELDVPDPSDVVVLRDIRRDTAHWPATHLTLCDTRKSPPWVWQETGWTVRHDSAAALQELSAAHSGHRLSLDLDPMVGAARRSRELITEACARWERPDLAGSACIVVTELVNNVVSHARTPMIVLLAVHGDGMSVAVRDRSASVPTFTGAPAPTSYGGRGMLLIDSVASSWGSLVLADGKVVWALIHPEHHPARMAGPDRG